MFVLLRSFAVSFVPVYTNKAQAALAGLNPHLQEDVLDEVERLLENPGLPSPAVGRPSFMT